MRAFAEKKEFKFWKKGHTPDVKECDFYEQKKRN